ncbi:ankyrin repeat domain-containing protein [Planctomycetota bacterium]
MRGMSSHHTVLGFILIIVISPCLSAEQTIPKECQTIQNLRAFAKLYGYVKYFHPSDEASSIDWDVFAVYAARKVKKAQNSGELKDILESLFLPIAPTIQIYSENEKPRDYSKSLPENTVGLKVVAWQHLGVRLNGWGGYKSLRLNREKKLPPGWKGRVYQIFRSVDMERFRGKEIEVRGALRTSLKSPESWASLSIIVITKDGESLDYLMDNRLTGVKPWNVYELTGKIPHDARRIDVGVVLSGMGQMWADEIGLHIIGNSDERQSVEIQNAGFEQADDNSLYPSKWSWPETSWYGHKIDNTKPYKGKRCLLLEPLQRLFEEHPQVTETITKPLDSGLMCQIPLALYRDKRGTLGENDLYPSSVLSERLKEIDPNEFTANDEDVRLADVIITWNVFQHFYPYFDVVDVDWDSELTNALQKAMRDKNVDQFYDTLCLLVAKLQDGHGFVSRRQGVSVPRMNLPSGIERGFFPFAVDWIENQVVVTISKDPTKRIQRGDIIVSVDGTNTEQVLLDIEQYLCGSPHWRRYEALAYRYFTYGSKEKKANLTIKRGGELSQVQMERNQIRRTRPEEPIRARIEKIQDGIFYVDLMRATMTEIEEKINDLATAKGVIFDLRGYPNGNAGIISYLLHQKDTSDCWMRIPKVIYPDREKLVGYVCSGWSMKPREPRIKGKVVFLTNAEAISYAESLMGFVEHYKLGEIVGQPTAGTNGNVNPFWLPGKFRVSWTGMKVVKHDGSQNHLIGTLPTVPVQRTIQGIIDGRDEYLERALEIIDPKAAEKHRATEKVSIHIAAHVGNQEKVKAFLDQGIDIEVRDHKGYTPLHCASLRGHEELIQFLISRGADENATDKEWGNTPLHKAASARHRQIQVVELLIAGGADVTAKNDLGQTALDLARQKRHGAIIGLLKKHGTKE